MKTLEELLRMQVPVNRLDRSDERVMSPEFVISVQEMDSERIGNSVRVIVRAYGHDSETLDFLVRGNSLVQQRL